MLTASSSLPGIQTERAAPHPLFGLAPGGVYHATSVSGGPVRSYRTLSPLPVPPRGPSAVYSLRHFPSSAEADARALPGTLALVELGLSSTGIPRDPMATHTSHALQAHADQESGAEAPDLAGTSNSKPNRSLEQRWSRDQKVQNSPALISVLDCVISSWLSCRKRYSARTPKWSETQRRNPNGK